MKKILHYYAFDSLQYFANDSLIPNNTAPLLVQLGKSVCECGHFREKETAGFLKNRYFWPKCQDDIANNCDACIKFKASSPARDTNGYFRKSSLIQRCYFY